MSLKGKKIGFALTGSSCNFSKVFPEIEKLVEEGADVYPIISEAVNTFDTRFGTADEWKEKLRTITEKEPIKTIVEAEPVGPQLELDILVVVPCTGNTCGKLANGITDTPVTMAVKAHLRNNRPVVLGVATNDGLGASARNLGVLINAKHIYFVPLGQDNPEKKPKSLVADFSKLKETIEKALEGEQIQPVLI